MSDARNNPLFSTVGIGVFVCCGGLCLFSTIIFMIFGVDRVPISINLVNNTNETVMVEIDSKSYTVRTGEIIELPWFRNADALISVQKENAIWNFHWIFSVPRSYLVQYHYYVQLEQNATLYLLPYKISSPVNTLPMQPSGYPLHARIQKKEKVLDKEN